MDKLSQQTLNKLHNVLTEVEGEIGHLCEINIKQLDKDNYGHNSSLLTVGNINISLEIYDAIDEYKELECIIDKCDSIYDHSLYKLKKLLQQKYVEERFSSIYYYESGFGGDEVGICRNCNKWKHDDYNDSYNCSLANTLHLTWGTWYDKCQACGILWTDLKYYSPIIDSLDYLIYNQKHQIIAKFRMIRSVSTPSLTSDIDALIIII